MAEVREDMQEKHTKEDQSIELKICLMNTLMLLPEMRVNPISDDQSHDLAFDHGLTVVNNRGVLHQIQVLDFFKPGKIKVLFFDLPINVLENPVGCIFWFDDNLFLHQDSLPCLVVSLTGQAKL